MFYDWQDRLVATKSGTLVTEESSLGTAKRGFQVDGLSGWLVFDPAAKVRGAIRPSARSPTMCSTTWARSPAEYVYAGNGVSLTSTDGVPDQPSAGLLRAETTTGTTPKASSTRARSTASIRQAAQWTTCPRSHQHDLRPQRQRHQHDRPAGPVTTYEYDRAGRQTEVIQPAVYDAATTLRSPTTITTYDNDGNVLTVTDPNGNVTTDLVRRRGPADGGLQPQSIDGYEATWSADDLHNLRRRRQRLFGGRCQWQLHLLWL